jgi:DNA-binding NarL/FixJ family response regulator
MSDPTETLAGRISDTSPKRVVIADDDPLVREALADLIVDHPGLELVGDAASGDEAAKLCASLHPVVAVIDVMMPTGGVAAVEAIHAVSPGTRIIAFTARADRRTRERLLASGALQVVAKGGPVDIADAIHDLANDVDRP